MRGTYQKCLCKIWDRSRIKYLNYQEEKMFQCKISARICKLFILVFIFYWVFIFLSILHYFIYALSIILYRNAQWYVMCFELEDTLQNKFNLFLFIVIIYFYYFTNIYDICEFVAKMRHLLNCMFDLHNHYCNN